MLTFTGPRPNRMDCCHNDGNPVNNKIDNLRYDTRSGNMQDAVKHGTLRTHFTMGGSKGTGNCKAKLDEQKVVQIRELHATGKFTYAALGRKFDVGYDIISGIVRRKIWKHVP